jgi:hypothetical protein
MDELSYAYLLGRYLGDGHIAPGRKHQRTIELSQWQKVIVRKYPGEFARGCSIPTAGVA